MEKRTPHCPLARAKELVERGQVRATFSALTDASEMGFDLEGMITVIMALELRDFHKSMTTYADHTIWQDVYRPSTELGDVYLKLTVINDVVIVSFKEL
jgi:motility quorum-sensing regulator/GCU-specific mRNA interferase toxin